ncbi:MAG: succinylglutamate desuccinylase/aspartoacylase family protein, partial [Asgard group archaeon]|nr:succinylglutamate desuccinylase/aspartoacylase family protein [Asgard group archaeon]
MTIQIGNLESIPEDIVTGFVDLFEHPTGTIERIPVIIAEGSTIGPVLWITANIHGNEYAGIPVIHRLLNSLSLDSLRGTIVAIPSLNPAGSRIKERSPYYDSHDPNRLFPDGNPHKKSYPHTIDKNLLIQNEHLKTNQQVNTNQKLESNANKNEKS